ncbi:putative Mitogen-activated protein kinase kinase kinase 7 [Hypsibius exemplaris]|uniref:Mitogen-activated protein kinase kinase kinase 7 n=1 Tax=Hypsibius exemplaris TaxID=2072580 RepID=A0A1W0WZL1_HYPEX|nr:putative Mitogen-activated protein kinase kinase kinase 7 [Hypsibius exemplaris]
MEFRYEDLEFLHNRNLGAGAYGVVKKAKLRGEVVAVKEQLSNSINSAKVGLIFDREICSLRLLRHENIANLIGTCLHDPNLTQCIVTEFVEGGSLENHLHKDHLFGMKRTEYSMSFALRWISHCALALQFLHGKNFIHRDLKTANILLYNHYRDAKVCDFGLATPLKSKLSTSRGTASYMAPEVFTSFNNYSYSCDIYSLGIVIWEIFSRREPYATLDFGEEGITSHNLLVAVSKGLRPKPFENGPPEIVSLITACYAADPKDRPTATDVCKLVADFQDVLSINLPLPIKDVASKLELMPDITALEIVVNEYNRCSVEKRAWIIFLNTESIFDRLEALLFGESLPDNNILDLIWYFLRLMDSLMDGQGRHFQDGEASAEDSSNVESKAALLGSDFLHYMLDQADLNSDTVFDESFETIAYEMISQCILSASSDVDRERVRSSLLNQPSRILKFCMHFQELYNQAEDRATLLIKPALNGAYTRFAQDIANTVKDFVGETIRQNKTLPVCSAILQLVRIAQRHDPSFSKYDDICKTGFNLLTLLSAHEKPPYFLHGLDLCVEIAAEKRTVWLFGIEMAQYLLHCINCDELFLNDAGHLENIWKICGAILTKGVHGDDGTRASVTAKLLEIWIIKHQGSILPFLPKITPVVFDCLRICTAKYHLVTRHRLLMVIIATLYAQRHSALEAVSVLDFVLGEHLNAPTKFADILLRNIATTSGPVQDKRLLVFGLTIMLEFSVDREYLPKYLPAILCLLQKLMEYRLSTDCPYFDPKELPIQRDHPEYNIDEYLSTSSSSMEFHIENEFHFFEMACQRIQKDRQQWNVRLVDTRIEDKELLKKIRNFDRKNETVTCCSMSLTSLTSSTTLKNNANSTDCPTVESRSNLLLPVDAVNQGVLVKGNERDHRELIGSIPRPTDDDEWNSAQKLVYGCNSAIESRKVDRRHVQYIQYKELCRELNSLTSELLVKIPPLSLSLIVQHLSNTYKSTLDLELPDENLGPVWLAHTRELELLSARKSGASALTAADALNASPHCQPLISVIIQLIAQTILLESDDPRRRWLHASITSLMVEVSFEAKLLEHFDYLAEQTTTDSLMRDGQDIPSSFIYTSQFSYSRAGRHVLRCLTNLTAQACASQSCNLNSFEDMAIHVVTPLETYKINARLFNDELFGPLAVLTTANMSPMLWQHLDCFLDWLCEPFGALGHYGFHSYAALCLYNYSMNPDWKLSGDQLDLVCSLCIGVLDTKDDDLHTPHTVSYYLAAKMLEVIVSRYATMMEHNIPELVNGIFKQIMQLPAVGETLLRVRLISAIIAFLLSFPEITTSILQQASGGSENVTGFEVFLQVWFNTANSSDDISEISDMTLNATGLITLLTLDHSVGASPIRSAATKLIPLIIDSLRRLEHNVPLSTEMIAIHSINQGDYWDGRDTKKILRFMKTTINGNGRNALNLFRETAADLRANQPAWWNSLLVDLPDYYQEDLEEILQTELASKN